jgi:hypothetical protein
VVRMGWRHANDGDQPAEPIVAADRFAPKIILFDTIAGVRSRPAELNRYPGRSERQRRAPGELVEPHAAVGLGSATLRALSIRTSTPM